jgi:hypothetical protein
MALIDPKDVLRKTPHHVTIDINNMAEVDALFTAAIQRLSPKQLADYIRQRRSAEEIRADNIAEQKDKDEEERGDYR